MIKLTQNTPTAGDCTAGYAVELDKEYTIGVFINEVLFKGEWGYIGIYNEGQAWFEFGHPRCEYKWGVLHTQMPDEFLSKKIKSVSANGGWGRMDYLLYL